MKRTGNLFDRVFTPENLYQAYLDARTGKRNRRACFDFETRLGYNLDKLHREIHTGAYRVSPYRVFQVTEPKPRTIHGPHFRDIVVQHAIYRIVYPLFDRTFIDQSFACRNGKGTHKASDYVQRALRLCSPDSYTLKLDIRKFFYRIDRAVLRLLIERKLKDRRLVDLMMLYADCETPAGIPIGNLLSQLYALIYLNPLDHFIKRALKIQHYVRYVDDFILIGLTRDQCLKYRDIIVRFLADNLKLELSKSTIQKVKRGLNFVGYRTWASRRLIRKHSLFRFKRKVRHSDQKGVASLLGHALHTSSMKHLLTILTEAMSHDSNLRIPKNFRPIHHAPGHG